MPSALSYPGVYIEEVPSGVRAITGVATSITAFVGRALRGPVDEPIMIGSYGEFERNFGGVWVDATLGYAVRDFYLNGGSQAVIVRLFGPAFTDDADRDEAAKDAKKAADAVATAATTAAGLPAATPATVATAAKNAIPASPPATAHEVAAATAISDLIKKASTASGADPGNTAGAATAQVIADAVKSAAAAIFATIDANGLKLEAANPGSWGNALRARVDHDTADTSDTSLFNLAVRDDLTETVELFRNVSITAGHARQVDKVLKSESALVRVAGSLPAARPTADPDPQPGDGVWGDNNPATNSKVADADVSTDGNVLTRADFMPDGGAAAKKGLSALDKADLFNLLCIPPHERDTPIEKELIADALGYCERRRAMMLIDPRPEWEQGPTKVDKVIAGIQADIGPVSPNGALFFPRLIQADPKQDGREDEFAPCGAMAGIFARTDTNRGVWKAPAGLEATIKSGRLSVPLTDLENGRLNVLGVNCLRSMPGVGPVIWGARTRTGDDRNPNDWTYTPVRRTALYIEESLYRGTHWVVFEPNDEPLWASIRLAVGAFMQQLFRKGAFQGSSPREAYFVKCDKETTTQADINIGVVNILVGFAPLKPAEFVVIKLQQIAGNIPT